MVMFLVVFFIESVNAQCGPFQIYESFGLTSGAPTQGGTWAVNSISYLTGTTARTGNSYLVMDAAGDWIRTPLIANPNILSFWYRRSSNTDAWSLQIQVSSDNSTWTTVQTISTVTTTYTQFTFDFTQEPYNNIYIRLRDNRSSGTAQRYIDDFSLTSSVSSENTTIIQGISACTVPITCGVTYNLYDIGGVNDSYNNSMTSRPLVISPEIAGGIVSINIPTIGIEVQFDGLILYNNNTNSAPLFSSSLGAGSGTTPPPNGSWWGTSGAPGSRTSTHSSGAITIDMLSDGTTTGTGFAGTVTCVVPSNCSGQPNAGTAAISVLSGCASSSFNLSATGLTSGVLGINYQWESAPSALGPWTSINGANSSTLSTSVSQTTFFRILSSCSFSGEQNISNVVSFTTTGSPCTCLNYPIFSATSDFDSEITNVTVGTMNHTSACTPVAPGPGSILNRYSNFTTSVTGPVAGLGNTVNFSLTQTSCDEAHPNFFQIYVDWNQDGDFLDAGEQVYSQPTAVNGNNIATGNFVVPPSAILGNTRMRVVCNEANASTGNFAHNNYSWGETEDYCFTVTDASGPSCPNAASIAPSAVQTICQNGTTNQLTATYTTGGVTGTPTPQYQWYSNTTNSNLISTATLIVGATSSTFTPPSNTVGTLYYFCVVYSTDNGCTQTNATQSLASNAVQVTIVDPNTAYNSSDFGTVATVNTGSSVNHLVISQVYGGAGLAYPYDYVEIFNPTGSTITVSNWSIQYQTSAGTTWPVQGSFSASIPPGGYYLIHIGSVNTSLVPAITADASFLSASGFNGTNAKIALVNTNTAITSCTSTNIVDKVSYGAPSVSCAEGSSASIVSANSLFRALNGCQDNNNNSTDFSNGTPNPRNSGSPTNPCSVTAPTTFCQSGTPSAMSVSGVAGGSSYSYQWYERSGLQTCPTGNSTVGWTLIPGAIAATYTPSSPITASTTYACLVTINGSPCNATRWSNNCVQITIHPNPIPVISGNTALCAGGSLTLSSSSASSYSWTPNGQTTSSITVNSTGTYGVTVTDSNGCTGSASVVVNAAANAFINLITSP